MSSILALTSESQIDDSRLHTIAGSNNIDLSNATIIPNSTSIISTPSIITAGPFEIILSSGPAGHHSLQFLAVIAPFLSSGGKLLIHETNSTDDTISSINKNILFSGLTAAQSQPLGDNQNSIVISAEKPAWQTGTKAAITLKNKPNKTAWNIDDTGNDELIDEDDLLTEDDLRRPINTSKNDDCEVGANGRKACANCTCGRAEGKVQKLTKEMIENPGSVGGCGSCSLGDAFRCGGCPYRGLPAFEPGKKIELPAGFLVDDLE